MSEWFVETDERELSFGYKVKSKLAEQTTEFQKIEIFDTVAYGKMMVIDGFVMLTESDEFVYHEMISHVPMCLHEDPKDVLVIGGGDGGTVRELVRHPSVKKVVLCEIDGGVVDYAKQFFPAVSCALDHPKVEVRIADGIDFIKKSENAFDVIIVDSTDPIGPGEGLFTGEFYKNVKKALRPGGIMTAQSESPWAHAHELKRIYNNIHSGFQTVKPYVGSVPTYPRGLWSWTLATNDAPLNFSRERFEALGEMQYLRVEMFDHLFKVPPFYAKKLELQL
jgi:spermidine synthase